MEIAGYKFIGVGSGGTNLAHFVCQHLNFHDPNAIVTLVDGDKFEDKNFKNQRFRDIGKKAEIKKNELRSMYKQVRVRSYSQYLTPDNIAKLIEDGDIVFLGVDNHKTRSIVNAYCKKLDNIVIINGGLENTDGDVLIYIRENGKDITPDLSYRHPEIAEPSDIAPYEKSCDDVIESEPARLPTVLAVATLMMTTFINYLSNNIDFCEIHIDTATTKMRKIPIPPEFA